MSEEHAHHKNPILTAKETDLQHVLDKQHIQSIQQRISDQSHRLPFLIHPLFTSYNSLRNTPKRTKYRERLFSWLAQCPYQTIAVAEVAGYESNTFDIFRNKGYNGHILFYRTVDDSADPKNQNFSAIYDALVQLKVSDIILAGQQGVYPHVSQFRRNPHGGVQNILVEDLLTPSTMYGVVTELGKKCVAGFLMGIISVIRDRNESCSPIHSFTPYPLISD